jgi:hypothetical protein
MELDVILQTTQMLHELGVPAIDLIPYHRLGALKYRALGKRYWGQNIVPSTSETLEGIKAAIEEALNRCGRH